LAISYVMSKMTPNWGGELLKVPSKCKFVDFTTKRIEEKQKFYVIR